jgi:hypothetical protein
MELSSDIESEWESSSEPESISIQKKLIMKHKYVITIDGTNQTYYGTCQCPDSYLFSDVVHFNFNKYIGLHYFLEIDHFIDTHEKMD